MTTTAEPTWKPDLEVLGQAFSPARTLILHWRRCVALFGMESRPETVCCVVQVSGDDEWHYFLTKRAMRWAAKHSPRTDWAKRPIVVKLVLPSGEFLMGSAGSAMSTSTIIRRETEGGI